MRGTFGPIAACAPWPPVRAAAVGRYPGSPSGPGIHTGRPLADWRGPFYLCFTNTDQAVKSLIGLDGVAHGATLMGFRYGIYAHNPRARLSCGDSINVFAAGEGRRGPRRGLSAAQHSSSELAAARSRAE